MTIKKTKKKTIKKPKAVASAPASATEAKPETVLVLRLCRENLGSHNGFKWPAFGPVSAPDWSPTPTCGYGLHGWLWGEGDAQACSYFGPTAKWLVVEVLKSEIVGLDNNQKVKFPRGVVVFCGDQLGATKFIAENGAFGKAIIGGTSTSGARGTSTSGAGGTSTSGAGGTSTSGARGTSTSGAGGTSTSGARGTSTSGDGGTSTSGYGGTSTSGDGGTSTSGAGGTSTSGARGTSTSGDGGTSTSGDGGTSTSGYGGTSTSGARGTSTSGAGGTSTSGDGGTSTSGDGGILVIRYWDRIAERGRLVVGYVGEDGIEPNTTYKLDDDHKFQKVQA